LSETPRKHERKQNRTRQFTSPKGRNDKREKLLRVKERSKKKGYMFNSETHTLQSFKTCRGCKGDKVGREDDHTRSNTLEKAFMGENSK